MWSVDIGSAEYWIRISLFCFGIYGLATLLIALRAERRGASNRRLLEVVGVGFILSAMVACADPGFAGLGVLALLVLLPATVVDERRLRRRNREVAGVPRR